MPHMANLNWLIIYCLINIILLMIMSLLTNKSLMLSKKENTSLIKQQWKW